MGGLLVSTVTFSAVESRPASGSPAVQRDKAGMFDRGHVAMHDGNELSVIARGDDIMAATVASPGMNVAMEEQDYGQWGGAEAHLTMDLPDDPTAMTPEQMVSAAEVARLRDLRQAAEAHQESVLGDIVDIAFSELDAYVAAHPQDFRSPDEPILVQVSPGLLSTRRSKPYLTQTQSFTPRAISSAISFLTTTPTGYTSMTSP
jgi:hypothetical protein